MHTSCCAAYQLLAAVFFIRTQQQVPQRYFSTANSLILSLNRAEQKPCAD